MAPARDHKPEVKQEKRSHYHGDQQNEEADDAPHSRD